MLHGAIGAAVQLQPLKRCLSDRFNVYSLDFAGHGGRPYDSDFTIELFANDVLQFVQQQNLDRVNIFGYSMGGYVAMYLAKHHAGKVNKIVTLATKYHWDEVTAAKEIKMLDPEKMEQKIPAFAAILRERHQPNDWKDVLKRTAEMMNGLGNDNPLKMEDYAAITTPSLLLLGDRDKMVTLEETVAVYKALPNAMMGMLPGTQHPIEQVNANTLAYMIDSFFMNDTEGII